MISYSQNIILEKQKLYLFRIVLVYFGVVRTIDVQEKVCAIPWSVHFFYLNKNAAFSSKETAFCLGAGTCFSPTLETEKFLEELLIELQSQLPGNNKDVEYKLKNLIIAFALVFLFYFEERTQRTRIITLNKFYIMCALLLNFIKSNLPYMKFPTRNDKTIFE